uniref:Uncharacterized protein n=1 Tax=Anguilla anguilla TaxID=7936 RepID=A0A0E9XUW6_ANGAN
MGCTHVRCGWRDGLQLEIYPLAQVHTAVITTRGHSFPAVSHCSPLTAEAVQTDITPQALSCDVEFRDRLKNLQVKGCILLWFKTARCILNFNLIKARI